MDRQKLIELSKKIQQWAEDRNIIKGTTSAAQTLKLGSEIGELAGAFNVCDNDEIKDGMGDVFVMICNLVAQENLSMPLFLETVNPSITDDAFLELFKHYGKLCDAVVKRIELDITNSIHGLLAAWMELDNLFIISDLGQLEDFVESAYNEIKDRKGIVYNGFFIKSTDPRYVSACEELGKAP